MAKSKALQKDYFQLTEHNTTQVVIFFLLITLGMLIFYYSLIPVMKYLFTSYLMGEVVSNGEKVNYLLTKNSILKETNEYFSWAVEIYIKTPQHTRYWFNPVVSLIIPCLSFGLLFAFLLTSALNERIGYIRQKIDREIAITLDNMCLKKYGFQSNDERNIIFKEIYNADLRDIYDFAQEYGMRIEDLKTLQRALKWRSQTIFYRILSLNDGLQLYLRFHFTVKYANQTLGLVYIGAAVLIIIIGLRGLKFIPATEPSLVFLALGLEFTLLLLFAFTVMYGREEDETHILQLNSNNSNSRLNNELGDANEVESLLRVFIKSIDKEDKK